MEIKQTNRVAMIRETIALLLTSPEVKAIPALQALIVRLVALMEVLSKLIGIQSRSVTDHVADRDKVVDAGIDAALAIALPALSYANGKNLGELGAKLRLTRTTFRNARIEKRPQLLAQVYDAVAPIVFELADSGITAEQVAAFKELVDAATDAVCEPRRISAEKAEATREIARTLRMIDVLLKDEIDLLVAPLEQKHPAFYARYKAARTIIDRAATLNTLDGAEGTKESV